MTDLVLWFVLWIMFTVYMISVWFVSPTELRVRLYELGYSTGQQQAILSGLTK